MDNTVAVYLWNRLVGALFWDEKRNLGIFEYDTGFLKSGLEISPFKMPLSNTSNNIFVFNEHVRSNCFNGLPGLLADALPDRFGNDILNAWLASRGLSTDYLNPAVRLSYVGNRGMGALEFKPSAHSRLLNRSVEVSLSAMNDLCENILLNKKTLDVNLSEHDDHGNTQAMNDILRIGSSAGGAKPKAIIAMNEAGHVLSGQVDAPPGYKHWLIKFDIAGEFDRARNNGVPPASGRIEYAYYLMAKEAGITMNECRLLEIGSYGHFLTERFDRIGNAKVHIQTLSALEHFDRDHPHDYAQLIATVRKFNLGMPSVHEVFRRMVFNVLTYNHDDHTKNFAFMMNPQGEWSLTPAYDVTYAFDPTGKWTRQHQMSVFGKNDQISMAELLTAGEQADIKAHHAQQIINQIKHAVGKWPEFAKRAGLDLKTSNVLLKLLDKSSVAKTN